MEIVLHGGLVRGDFRSRHDLLTVNDGPVSHGLDVLAALDEGPESDGRQVPTVQDRASRATARVTESRALPGDRRCRPRSGSVAGWAWRLFGRRRPAPELGREAGVASQGVHVLLLEDDDVDAEAVMRSIRRARVPVEVMWVEDGVYALEVLHGDHSYQSISRPVIVLLDLNMPRMDGFEFCKLCARILDCTTWWSSCCPHRRRMPTGPARNTRTSPGTWSSPRPARSSPGSHGCS